MIFIKWLKYAGTDDPKYGACAPNLLIGKNIKQIIITRVMKDKYIYSSHSRIDQHVLFERQLNR